MPRYSYPDINLENGLLQAFPKRRSARQLEAVQQKALSIWSVDSACIPSLSERRSFISLRLFFSILYILTTCPVSVIGHMSTLPLHAHYAIHLPFAFHALAHPCFCPLLSTSLLLPTTLLLLKSELNFCLSLLPPSILLIYSGSSSLKLILNISIFPFWFLLLDEKNIIIMILIKNIASAEVSWCDQTRVDLPVHHFASWISAPSHNVLDKD